MSQIFISNPVKFNAKICTAIQLFFFQSQIWICKSYDMSTLKKKSFAPETEKSFFLDIHYICFLNICAEDKKKIYERNCCHWLCRRKCTRQKVSWDTLAPLLRKIGHLWLRRQVGHPVFMDYDITYRARNTWIHVL